jgi:hypothetical protein
MLSGLVMNIVILGYYWVKIRPEQAREILDACQRLRERECGVGALVKDKFGEPFVITKVSPLFITLRMVKNPTLIRREQLRYFEYQNAES